MVRTLIMMRFKTKVQGLRPIKSVDPLQQTSTQKIKEQDLTVL